MKTFLMAVKSNIRRLNSNYSREQFPRRLACSNPKPNSNSHKPNSHKYGNFANFVSIAEYVQHICLQVAKNIADCFHIFLLLRQPIARQGSMHAIIPEIGNWSVKLIL